MVGMQNVVHIVRTTGEFHIVTYIISRQRKIWFVINLIGRPKTRAYMMTNTRPRKL
jgi:hypothetical protein